MNSALLDELARLRAFSSHLLGGFLRLRERYAMLHPMLFSASVIEGHGAGERASGFAILKDTLFMTCCQDIANLVADEHKTSVSIANVVKKLRLERVAVALEDAAVAAVLSTDHDPDIQAFWSAKQQDRRLAFRADLAKLLELADILTGSSSLGALKTIRKKAASHLDLSLRNGEYAPLNFESLGMKWKDLEAVIDTTQEVVVLIGNVVRDASFAWESFEKRMSRTTMGFWSTNVA